MAPLRLAATASALSLALAAAPALADDVPATSGLGRWGSLGGIAAVYASATTYMYLAWYHGQPDRSFTVGGDGWFGEGTYAGGADKVGHASGALILSRISSELLIRGGWEPWKAGVIGSSMTLGLFTAFEVKDGFHTEFSPGDAVFNAIGAGLNVAMLAYPRLDALIDFRVEYFPSEDYRDLLAGRRPPQDPAEPHQVSLNFVEDYSGQRYLLALHLGALPWLRGHTWARLVDAAVGYETRRYRPEPIDPLARRSQRLFLGLSVNVQGLVDLALAGRPGALSRAARGVGHLAFELVNPPYGSIAVAGATRAP